MIDHYPIKSIKNIGNWLTGSFDLKVVRLMGHNFSLGDIEHHVLRRNHDERRVHFALVGAAVGCPPLRNEAYQEEKLDAQLDAQARRFLQQASKNRADLKSRTLHLSKIFKWYEKDLARKEETVALVLAPYFDAELARQIRAGGFEIIYTDFDWSLNDSASVPMPAP